MVSSQQFRTLALSFPGTTEQPHFENCSFRVGKKIFATLDEKNKKACLKFNEIDQDVFARIDKAIIYPVPNKWGKQGWTFIELARIKKTILMDALATAFCEVAPPQLKKQYNGDGN